MNSVQLLGRLTKDVELRYSQGGTAFCSFTLAVPRKYKKDNMPDCNFINCKSFGKTAEFMGKYLSKGRQIVVSGSIDTGSYEKEGKRIFTTDVMVNEVNFADGKKEETAQQQQQPFDYSGGMTDEEKEGLPF